MKYSNLTYSEKILKWFEVNPKTINSVCEDGYHILDWIYGGYNGKVSAKVDLTFFLLSRNANLGLVKINTYKNILQTFLSDPFSQNKETGFVLQCVLNQKQHLNNIKNDQKFFNSLILNDTVWDSPNCNIKNQILYSEIITPSYSNEEHEYKINIYAHPIEFLLEQYFFYLYELRNYNTYTFRKIDKIHELNENIFLEDMYLNFKGKTLDNLEHFSINKNDSVNKILEKVKQMKELKINNLNNPFILHTIDAINNTIHRDFYRKLQIDVLRKDIKEYKHKL